MTLFAAALRLVGLSHAEAAEFFGVRIDTVKSWSAGRNRPPAGAWDELRALYQQQIVAVEEALTMAEGAEDIALNEHGPRAAEWPSKGAHMAALAMIALDPDCPPLAQDSN